MIQQKKKQQKLLLVQVNVLQCAFTNLLGEITSTVSEMTGTGESTVIRIVDEVYQVIVENMWHESLEKHFPKSKKEFLVKMQEMESEWQFEYAFSAIDGS